MTMNDLVAALAAETNLSRTQVRSVLDAFTAQVGASMKVGDDVRIAGLGVFEPKKSKERTGRNPRTGEAIKIKASTAIRYRAAGELKKLVNG